MHRGHGFMHKRTFAVLGVAAAAGAVLPFGLPQVAHATGFTTIAISPLPIAQPGTLAPNTTVQLCVQPRNGSAPAGVGVTVYLSFYSGLFTAPPVSTSTAKVGTTVLTTTPAAFQTVASCSFTGGTATDSIPVTYTSPNPTVPPHGRDVVIAADSVADSGITGSCPGSAGTLCNNGTYVYSPVTQYAFNPAAPIAPTGSLAAGQSVTFNVIAEDSAARAVPGAFLDLSLTSSAGSLGTATGINMLHAAGHQVQPVTNTPSRFGSDSNGSVAVTYTAANPLPSPAAGTDTITVQNHPTTPTVTASTTYSYGAGAGFTQAPYTAVTPFRVCDTRPTNVVTSNQCNTGSTGGGTGPVTQGQKRVVTIVGFGGVPSGATAVVVNLTAIAPTRTTYLTLLPDGGTPGTSNLNPAAGSVIANLVEVGLSAGGKIDVYNPLGSVNVALDIEGYVSPGSTELFTQLAPSRICDTRSGASAPQCTTHGPIVGGSSLSFNVHTASDGIPTSGVSAVVFNLTAIAPTTGTVLTAYAGLTSAPLASNLNVAKGANLPNRVIVPVGTDGTVDIKNFVGSVNVAIDVNGWFGIASGAKFTSVTPARLCDTRTGKPATVQGCSLRVVGAGSSQALNLNVTGFDNIPPATGPHAPVAVVVNVTVVDASAGTFVAVYPGPAGSTVPGVSDLNVGPGATATNLVVVAVGSDGMTINLLNAVGNVNLIVDVLGFYAN
jgi:hypothetical protein